ncbi:MULTISPECIES: hypothetical protein [unclassified Streptomyces]|uniref:hypothetical protein n=1 Tax=unclassified Streptomyces TaxID=2593676 RepID=UPI00278BCA0E|nr:MULTISPECIES: hypothetical protein [unclassified Streptomyces]
MIPTPPAEEPVRSADAVNAEIRTLVESCGGWLYGETRARYEVLIVEWAAAVRGEIVEAA